MLTERVIIHVAFLWNGKIHTVQCACFTFEHSYQICREHSQGHFLPTFAQNLCDHKYSHVFSFRKSLYPDVMQHKKCSHLFFFSSRRCSVSSSLPCFCTVCGVSTKCPSLREVKFCRNYIPTPNPQRLNATWRSYVCLRSRYPGRISLQLRLGQEGVFFVLGT